MNVAAPLMAAEEPEPTDTLIRLGEIARSFESVAFLRDSRTVVLVSDRDQRLVLVDVHDSEIVKVVDYASQFELEGAVFSDIAVDLTSRFVFLVGESRRFHRGLLVRLDLESYDFAEVRFEDEFARPSVAVSESGGIFIGDLNSSTITVFEPHLFDEFAGDVIRRSDLGRNIYLKRGPAIDLGVSRDGRFMIVSHAQYAVLSLVDSEVADVVDELGTDEGRVSPLPMVVTNLSPRSWQKESLRTAVVVAVIEEDVLITAYLDEQFQSFRRDEFARLELGITQREPAELPSLLLSASDNLETIVVGHRSGTRALFRSPIRARVVELPEPPDDIEVSPDGRTAVILSSVEATLRVIGNPVAWASQSGATPGSDKIREAQRLLSDLGYPVGELDGLDGPATRRGVRIFQETARLDPDGIVDAETMEQIRNVAAELEVGGAGTATDDPISACRPIDREERCRTRHPPHELLTSFAGRGIEEVTCAARDGDSMRVQVDSYRSAKKEPQEYLCTSRHSCAFVRFRDLDAYYEICEPTASK